jgi:TonB-dependent receptor
VNKSSLAKRFCAIIATLAILCVSLHADTPSGSVNGRVQNAVTEEYIYGARIKVVALVDEQTGQSVAIQNSKIEMTDQSGSFHIDNLPVGQITLAVSYLGMPTQTVSATIKAGSEVSIPDIQLRRNRAGNEIVKLDAYQVNVEKDMSNREIAINTQKFADNFKSVVSVDDLGFIADGSIANAMKYMPGVEMETDAYGYGTSISMSGAPSSSVPITFGGFSMTTSSDNNQGVNNSGGSSAVRTTQLMTLSLNIISRIEVNHTTLPDDPGSALAGSVNFVPKNAFELSHAQYQLVAYGASEQNQIGKSSFFGPMFKQIQNRFPGFNLSAIVPINKKLGFSVNFSTNTVPKYIQRQNLYWNANYNTSAGGYLATPLNPDHYFLNFTSYDNIQSIYQKTNINLTVDYKVSDHGTLSASFTQAFNQMQWSDHQVRWGSTSDINLLTSSLATEYGSYNLGNSTVPSSAGGPLVTYTNVNQNAQVGVANIVQSWVNQDANRQISLNYHYDYQGWKINFGNSYGNSRKQGRNVDANTPQIYNAQYNLRPLAQLEFNGINSNGFSSVIAKSVNGTIVNPLDINTFAAAGGFAASWVNLDGTSSPNVYSVLPAVRIKPTWASDHTFESKGDVSKDLNLDGSIFKDLPTTVKMGYDFKEYSREQRLAINIGTNGQGYIYTGPNQLSAFTSPYPNPFIGGLGGQGATAINNATIARDFLANPSNYHDVRPWADFSGGVNFDNHIMERVAATYIRFDTKLLNGRLKLAYGIRLEHTMDNGAGLKINGYLKYPTNALGQVVDTQGYPANLNGTDPDGKPQVFLPLPSSSTIAYAQSIYTALGSKSDHNYTNYFPSATASYNITNDFIARLSVSQTIGRPDFGQLYPSLTTPDPTQPPSPTSQQISFTNTGLLPWVSHNYGASLEYYAPDGQWNVTLRAYRRFVSHPWNPNQIIPPSQAGPLLAEYSINQADWPNTYVVTSINEPGVITTSGFELSGNYGLDKILPYWARGFGVRYTGTRATQTGGGYEAIQFVAQNLAQIPWSAGAGISLTRSRFQLMINGKWDSTQRLSYNDWTTNGGRYDPLTYQYLLPTVHVDLDLTVNVTNTISLFINGRDINKYKYQVQSYSPTTPNYAKNVENDYYQPVWTAGIKAKF